MQWAGDEVLYCGVGPPRAIGPMILAMDSLNPRDKCLAKVFKDTIQHLIWHIESPAYQALEDQHFQRLSNILDEQMVGALRMAKEHSDVIPPWILGRGIPPWSMGWRQGGGEAWFHSIWIPFWKGLSEEERVAFVNRWDAPSDWREYALSGR